MTLLGPGIFSGDQNLGPDDVGVRQLGLGYGENVRVNCALGRVIKLFIMMLEIRNNWFFQTSTSFHGSNRHSCANLCVSADAAVD